MLRSLSPLRATFLMSLWIVGAALRLAAEPASPSAPTPDLVGLSRAEVVALIGKPTGERQRGDLLMMVYADGRRVELRNGLVVAVSGGAAGEIIGADGAKYVPGADGKLQRAAPTVGADPTSVPSQVATSPESTPAPAESPAPAQAPATATPEPELDEDLALSPGAGTALPDGLATEALQKHVEAMEDPEESEPESIGKTVLVFAIGTVFRFGFALLVLRLAVHIIGVPAFWTDLAKVALLYLAVHGVLEGLGTLGGWWEFIPVFKLDDVVSFVVLACSLTWFKVAESGLTALKVAAATKFVVVGLMLAVGLALSFGLGWMN